MKPYLALIGVDLKLAFRDRSVLFFNYLFPLIFFFAFAEAMSAGGSIAFVVTMVLVLGVLGNGLFGAGIRATQEREQNILRRFKVAPISPAPLLVASMATGWVTYLPAVVIVLSLAHFLYGMPLPERAASLLILLSLGVVAFRAIGLMVAAVANSVQESNLITQLLYMPMLFLSGATVPIATLPEWAQITAQFLPASYLVTGFQGVFFRRESLVDNWPAVSALVVTAALALFLATRLFRWEKEERIRPTGKLWVLAVLLPFVLLGAYQSYSRDQIRNTRALWRRLQRTDTFLLRGGRIFVGDGRLIETGAVLVREGRIAEVFTGPGPDPEAIGAEVVETAGKTVMPGLIDTHVHLGVPAGFPASREDYNTTAQMRRAVAALLYCGVTTVRSAGDPVAESFAVRVEAGSGERLGAEVRACGPEILAGGGSGPAYLDVLPPAVRDRARSEWIRPARRADDARTTVRELGRRGAECVSVSIGADGSGGVFAATDDGVLTAVADQAQLDGLPIVARVVGESGIVAALAVGARSVVPGPARSGLSDLVLARLKAAGAGYTPALGAIEARRDLALGRSGQLEGSLVQQVVPPTLAIGTRAVLESGRHTDAGRARSLAADMVIARENLQRAYRAGVTLVAGTDAGHALVFHGPAIHRELQLWVQAGVPPEEALVAATRNAAIALGAADRLGLVAKGYEADLLVVDGNPIRDIATTERISLVVYRGERIRRAQLFEP
jgi:imidazolonepropionase-like amidohydrolase/ABC-type multidrug transport system permease subunit